MGAAPDILPAAAARVLVAGHVCLDVIPALAGPADFAPGALTEIGPADMSTGGAVANTGLALHRLGVPVRLMGKVGDDLLGRAVLEALRSHDAALADGMIVAAGEATSYSIVISPPGVDRSFLHCPGANDTFVAGDVRDDELGAAQLLHFGYPPLMRRMYLDTGAELQRLLARARGAGPATSLDLCRPDPLSDAGRVDWRLLLERTLPLVDVFAPSLDELLFMLDPAAHGRLPAGAAPAETIGGGRLAALAGQLLDWGATVVAIKLGDRGLYVRTSAAPGPIGRFCARLGLNAAAWRDREVLSPCFQPRRIAGTTGAGDCTIAGLLAALCRGEEPVTAATSATAVGACSVEAPDATSGVPRWEEVAARLQAGWPRLPSAVGLGRAGALTQTDPLGTLSSVR